MVNDDGSTSEKEFIVGNMVAVFSGRSMGALCIDRIAKITPGRFDIILENGDRFNRFGKARGGGAYTHKWIQVVSDEEAADLIRKATLHEMRLKIRRSIEDGYAWQHLSEEDCLVILKILDKKG